MKLPRSIHSLLAACIVVAGVAPVGCKETSRLAATTVSTRSLTRAALDTGKVLTLLRILEVYPALKSCDATSRYANLYVCRKFTDGDTVYVFEECREVNKLALDTVAHYAGVVTRENLKDKWPDSLTIFVPAGFRMGSNVKCFLANLDFQTEY
jgi:hypothetical protein